MCISNVKSDSTIARCSLLIRNIKSFNVMLIATCLLVILRVVL